MSSQVFGWIVVAAVVAVLAYVIYKQREDREPVADDEGQSGSRWPKPPHQP